MSRANSLIEECRTLGISLTAADGKLIFTPASAMPDELAARLRANKSVVLAAIAPSIAKLDVAYGRTRGPRDEGFVDALPQRPCRGCGCAEFARDLADQGWVCTRCHPPSEFRSHLPRCRAAQPSARITGAPNKTRAI